MLSESKMILMLEKLPFLVNKSPLKMFDTPRHKWYDARASYGSSDQPGPRGPGEHFDDRSHPPDLLECRRGLRAARPVPQRNRSPGDHDLGHPARHRPLEPRQ